MKAGARRKLGPNPPRSPRPPPGPPPRPMNPPGSPFGSIASHCSGVNVKWTDQTFVTRKSPVGFKSLMSKVSLAASGPVDHSKLKRESMAGNTRPNLMSHEKSICPEGSCGRLVMQEHDVFIAFRLRLCDVML